MFFCVWWYVSVSVSLSHSRVCVCVCITCMWVPTEARRGTEALKLELQVAVSLLGIWDVGVGKKIQVLCKIGKHPQPLSQPSRTNVRISSKK